MRQVTVVVLMLTLTACGRRWGPPPDISGLTLVNGVPEELQMGDDVRRLLEEEQWDSLDLLARELRSSDSRFPDGTSRLRVFYSSGTGKVSGEVNDLAWINQIRQLKAWVAARPGSMAARVGLAYGLHGYAWDARGTGWAKDIPDSARALMEARLTEATTVLLAARAMPEECPGWFQIALRLGNLMGMDDRTYEGLYDAATTRFPNYDAYPEYKSDHLLPSWGGGPRELEAFAAAAADRRGASEGDQLYARIAWHIAEYVGTEALFSDHALDWPRIRRGLAALRDRYPDSFHLTSESAALALAAGDRAEARTRLLELGQRVDVSVWKSREAFAVAQEELKVSRSK